MGRLYHGVICGGHAEPAFSMCKASSNLQDALLAEKSEWQITILWDHISVLKKYKCKYLHTERSGVIHPGTLSVGRGGLGGWGEMSVNMSTCMSSSPPARAWPK